VDDRVGEPEEEGDTWGTGVSVAETVWAGVIETAAVGNWAVTRGGGAQAFSSHKTIRKESIFCGIHPPPTPT
jgi:hypothetical protein